MSRIHITSMWSDAAQRSYRLHLASSERLYIGAKFFRVAGIKLPRNGGMANGDCAHERLLSEERLSWLHHGWKALGRAPQFSPAAAPQPERWPLLQPVPELLSGLRARTAILDCSKASCVFVRRKV